MLSTKTWVLTPVEVEFCPVTRMVWNERGLGSGGDVRTEQNWGEDDTVWGEKREGE